MYNSPQCAQPPPSSSFCMVVLLRCPRTAMYTTTSFRLLLHLLRGCVVARGGAHPLRSSSNPIPCEITAASLQIKQIKQISTKFRPVNAQVSGMCTGMHLHARAHQVPGGHISRRLDITHHAGNMQQHLRTSRNLLPGTYQKKKKQIGHHARPRRASATAPLRTGADTCRTGSGAGKRCGAKSDPGSVGGATHGTSSRVLPGTFTQEPSWLLQPCRIRTHMHGQVLCMWHVACIDSTLVSLRVCMHARMLWLPWLLAVSDALGDCTGQLLFHASLHASLHLSH